MTDVIAMIQKRGISFKPTDKDYASYKGMGVDQSIIAALQKAKFVEAEAGKPKSPYKRTALQTQGEPDKAFASAAAVSEGVYGSPCIVHACLETHGSASEWPADKEMVVHISTQNVSGIAAQMAEPLNVPAGNINVLQQNIGGGFGSKFSADRWDVNTANLSKKAGGKPVKNMLDRRAEFEVAGMRPSAYARVKIAADKRRQDRRPGTRARGEPAVWAAAVRLPCPTFLKFPTSASRTRPSPPTRVVPVRGALRIIRRQR